MKSYTNFGLIFSHPDSEENKDIKDLYDEAADRFILKLLDLGLNQIEIPTDLNEKNEQEINTMLNHNDFSTKKTICKISVPEVREEYDHSFETKNIFLLPMSLADEAYTCGEAVVYRQYSDDLDLGIKKRDEYIAFDNRQKAYDLAHARERYKMYQELEIHMAEIEKLKEAFESDKIVNETVDDIPQNELLTRYRQMTKKREIDMNQLVVRLEKSVQELEMQNAVSFIKSNSGTWSSFRDQYNTSVLHIFVEKGIIKVVECLLICGALVNEGEGCGVTPIMLAIMKNDVAMTKLLLKYEARVRGLFPGHLPSPIEMSKMLHLEDITTILEEVYQREERMSLRHCVEFLQLPGIQEDENSLGHSELSDDVLPLQSESSNSQQEQIKGARENIIIVGDVKTTVTTRGLKNRSPDEFGIFEETPGDFHALAYVMECIAKIFGTAGFYYVARYILNRLKVTPTSFEHMFKEENYERNFEALTDFYWGLGLALVKKFQQSEFFPDKSDIHLNEKKYGHTNNLILCRFKDWIQEQGNADKTFQFFSSFILDFGLLFQIFQEAVRYGNGKVREGCWMKSLCLFPPLNKKNYKDESFVHIVHFTTTWSIALREMFRQNCSISVKGKKHHNMAIDEYIESMVVKPMKEYAKKHTTLNMLQKINMNIELFKHLRKVYLQGFNIHKATSRSKPDSLPDRIKICWFAMKEKWFENLQRKDIRMYSHAAKEITLKPEDTINNKYIDTYGKGKKYIQEHFKEMLIRLFPNMDYVEQ